MFRNAKHFEFVYNASRLVIFDEAIGSLESSKIAIVIHNIVKVLFTHHFNRSD